MITAVDFVPVTSASDASVVARLAAEIWYEHYVPIIGREQVDYMVPRFQSEAAVLEQIAKGLQYFLIRCSGDACGYLAIEPQPAEHRMFLSKLYVLKASISIPPTASKSPPHRFSLLMVGHASARFAIN